MYRSEKVNARFQVDGDNLNNRLNVLDFGGLFSGNAIAPGRSVDLSPEYRVLAAAQPSVRVHSGVAYWRESGTRGRDTLY